MLGVESAFISECMKEGLEEIGGMWFLRNVGTYETTLPHVLDQSRYFLTAVRIVSHTYSCVIHLAARDRCHRNCA